MKRRVVILANSFKVGKRCIAGIDVRNGEWIRPVSPPAGGAVAWNLRTIGGREPELRDVVEMFVQGDGPDEGCQPENRLLKLVSWQHIRVMSVDRVLRYCENNDIILHNDSDSVEADYFQTIPKHQWKSLQLIRSSDVSFYANTWEGKKRWRARLEYGRKRRLDLGLTDPVLIERLSRNEKISHDCLLTISLAGPWTPGGIQPKRCYKLVAGVIEL
ncbi:MAG: hypothetical protein U9Q82_13180 [Chloroflexota bacterium]|nr:hypothetical protein [Chloroflexota bacterium]